MDVTSLILDWAECSNDVWTRWFLNRETREQDFNEVEDLLLEILVTDKLSIAKMSAEKFFSLLEIVFLKQTSANRSVFTQGKAGNLIGHSEFISIDQGCPYDVRSIDTTGRMLNDEPYIEVKLGKRFFLEPLLRKKNTIRIEMT